MRAFMAIANDVIGDVSLNSLLGDILILQNRDVFF